jgi:hypothetical protein
MTMRDARRGLSLVAFATALLAVQGTGRASDAASESMGDGGVSSPSHDGGAADDAHRTHEDTAAEIVVPGAPAG